MADSLDAAMARYARAANKAVDRYLQVGDHPTLRSAMRWIPMAGGKRLRPVLAQMVGEAVGGARGAKAALPSGVALEIIHNFTLVHDDIMDRSDLRRNKLTVHRKWDESTAINAGDALFARAFEIMQDVPGSDALKVELYGEVARMVRGIAEGQQWDMDFERARTVTHAQYLLMIERKTALMFSTGAYCGARSAGGGKRLARELEEYGRNLGIAFQIQDDLLDLGALEKDLGKPIGKDLRNGKRTIMVIDALRTLNGAELREFKSVLGNPHTTKRHVEHAVQLMEGCGALARARGVADRYGDNARYNLRWVRRGPARDRLESLISYVTSRAK